MGPPYGKLPILFPYHSHIFRDSYGSGMGIVWEAYHKGVPLLGVPENPIDPGEKTSRESMFFFVVNEWDKPKKTRFTALKTNILKPKS